MKYIFGPVFSRRLGHSLGVDLVPYKVCSMDCLYCEVGKTTLKTLTRSEYVPIGKVKWELEKIFSTEPEIDFVTFSGYGEPTLFSRIGELVDFIRENSSYPTALLTNSTLLYRDDVIEDVERIDVFLPSLDAATDSTMRKLNRPSRGVSVRKIVDGIRKLRERVDGKVWLETLFVKGINDGEEEVLRMGEVIHSIEPDEWQINTVARPPAYNVEGLSMEELERIADLVGFERTRIVARSSSKRVKVPVDDLKREVYTLVVRRPCSEDEIASALGILKEELDEVLKLLKSEGRVREIMFGDVKYIKGVKLK